jgi:dephospho-CoA kinase
MGRALRIGLTGPIGCGKSTVAGWLAEDPGVVAIDADDVARDVLAPGTPELGAVLARFGAGLRRADGSLDRAALGRVVFTDPAALRDLEAIVHPAVRPRIEARMAEADAAGAQVVVVEAIKLVEGGLASLCDEVWLVTCDPSVQLERVLTRGMDPADARTRVEAQGDLTDRLRPAATRILDTGPSPAAVRAATHAALAAALGGPIVDGPSTRGKAARPT